MPSQLIVPEMALLFFREGGSDKVYNVVLATSPSNPQLWFVNFEYGRRGGSLNTGTKTAAPVPYEKAKSIYDKLIREKTAKGYQHSPLSPQSSGAPAQPAVYTADQRDTGVRPQLLNEMTEADLTQKLRDDDWIAQEKFDGKRILIKRAGSTDITGINRKGLTVGLPQAVVNAAKNIPGFWLQDGELVGDVFYAFDLLEEGGDLRGNSYHQRLSVLERLIPRDGAIKIANSAFSSEEKRQLFERINANRGEGIVFKLLSAPYTAGRPNTGGSQLKFKLYATGSFIVQKVNAKRSVALTVIDSSRAGDAQLVGVGNVTIPPNKQIPAPGDVVEIRYLYAYRGGSLYQPTYLMQRDDIDRGDCGISQLKYKQDNDEEDA